MTSAASVLAAALARDLPRDTAAVGVAVSGGSDSLALMVLLADWANASGARVRVATVNHGLRADAAAEAADVAQQATELGLRHDVLVWRDWDGRGNLQAQARTARFALLKGWAECHGLTHVCLGHTRDDQAETVLLRLARGSGVDGLAGMAATRAEPDGVVWMRPLLGASRADLQAVLRARGLEWSDDPSNADHRFDRVKVRKALADGALAGIDAKRLSDTAMRMHAARKVLQQVAFEAARTCLHVDQGAVGLQLDPYAGLHDDTRWRLLSAAICRVGGTPYRPRLAALQRAETQVLAGRRNTLAGCLLSCRQGVLWIDREPAELAGVSAGLPGVWDGRWQVDGPAHPGLHLAALGACGLAQRPGWRKAGLRRTPLLTAPGVWQGTRLIAAPSLPETVDGGGHWQCRPLWDKIFICADLRSD